MPRTNLEFAQETNRWKNYLLDVDSIPFSDTHIFKDHNDVYERLTQHVKNWAEGELGYFLSDTNKTLQPVGYRDRTQESYELSNMVSGLLTPPNTKWFDAALSGSKKTKDFLPHYSESTLPEANKRMDAIREQVKSTFLPAYRALYESYNKRPFWHWITQHAQYTAERDSLKVIKNLIKSTTNMTDIELKNALIDNQANITDEYVQEVGNQAIPRIKMYQPSESNKVNELDYDYSELLRENNELNKHEHVDLSNEFKDDKNVEKSEVVSEPPYVNKELHP